MRHDVPRRLFRGRDLATVAEQARRALGDDVVLLNTRSSRAADGSAVIEAVAADATDVERFRAMVTATAGMRDEGLGTNEQSGTGGRQARVPSPSVPHPSVRRTIALVGPTGAGKTTTLAKLAINTAAFGPRRPALLTLDTYRAGAVQQLETYAHVAKLPFDVAYDAADATRARERLARHDVLLVDTPGRGPRALAGDDAEAWRAALDALAPDEIHLVLPAIIRPDIAEAVRDRFEAAGTTCTHVLLTKLDEVPGEEGITELAARLGLPVRWVTDGQEIPVDLHPGAPRLIEALGAFAGLPSPAGARIEALLSDRAVARTAGRAHPTPLGAAAIGDARSDAVGDAAAPSVTDVATSAGLDRPARAAAADRTPRGLRAVAWLPRFGFR